MIVLHCRPPEGVPAAEVSQTLGTSTVPKRDDGILCGLMWSKRACVWHYCCGDSIDKDDEEGVKEISWKRKLSPIYFPVDAKLLLGNLGRIWSVCLFSGTSDHTGSILCPQSPWASWCVRGLWISLSSNKQSHVSKCSGKEVQTLVPSFRGVCTYSFICSWKIQSAFVMF